MKRLIATTMIVSALAACTKDQLLKDSLTVQASNAKPTTPKNAKAQGIMIDFDVEGDYKLDEKKITYEFDAAAAAAYFTHSAGVVKDVDFKIINSKSGMTSTDLTSAGDVNLPSSYWKYFGGKAPSTDVAPYTSNECKPSAPAPVAPAKDQDEFQKVLDNNKCTFLKGGQLVEGSYKKFYESPEVSCSTITKIYFKGNDRNGKWVKEETTITGTYTWTYEFTISTAATVPAYTAWKPVSDANFAGIQIPVTAKIAALNAKTWKDGLKYSFKLGSIDAYGVQDSRITDLKVQLLSADGLTVHFSIDAPHVIKTNSNISPVDFDFISNAGTSGDLIILPEKKMSARQILNEDAFPANNNGGPSGNDLQIAEMPKQVFKIPADFPSGDYIVRIICKVKGEDGIETQDTKIQNQKVRIEANCHKPSN